MKVLLSAPYMIPVLDRFRGTFERNGIELVVAEVVECLDEGQLLEYVGDVHGVICGDDRFSARVLEAAPKLRVISKWGTGIDSIDLSSCERLGVKVFRTPNAFTQPVADTAMGYILCFARRLPWMDQEMKAGMWSKSATRALNECTLGIIGVGNIGRALALRAMAFGMRLFGNDPKTMPADFLKETGISMISRSELLERADFVSINCDLNPTSHHLIGHKEFSLMKPEAVLINTARGPIVSETNLIAALRQKRIAGAALDVFEDEPLSSHNPLAEMPNVMLAPHNANGSPAAWEMVHLNTIDNLINGLKEEAP